MDMFRIHLGLALGLLALIGCAGCSGPRDQLFSRSQAAPVWPEPPQPARIRHLATIAAEGDVARGPGLLGGLAQLVFGKKKAGALLAPCAVAMSGDGRLYVADSAGQVIHLFDFGRKRYSQFGAIQSGQTLQRPVALALSSASLYVVDSQLHSVCVFNAAGDHQISFGANELKRPAGIVHLPQRQEIVVADTGSHDLKVFSETGTFLRTIGSRGIGPGQFNFPTQLWSDRAGQIYVSDTLNYRIQVFSPTGQFLTRFGEQGDRPGYFAHPCGVATDRFGNIYVTDRQFENVQVFDRQGRMLMVFGQEGRGLGEFWLPAGIWIDERNWIYVADTYNKRIQVFEILEVSDHANSL